MTVAAVCCWRCVYNSLCLLHQGDVAFVQIALWAAIGHNDESVLQQEHSGRQNTAAETPASLLCHPQRTMVGTKPTILPASFCFLLKALISSLLVKIGMLTVSLAVFVCCCCSPTAAAAILPDGSGGAGGDRA